MTARESAWNLLRQWTLPGAPPLLPERGDPHPQWDKLTPRDRAFAFDLVTGVIRWRGLLDAVIATRLRQPLDHLDPAVRTLLWLGAYQLLIQGGTADYAAVDTSVTLARQYEATSKAAGLVNAVLRGITRLQGKRRQITTPALSRRTFPLDFSTEVTFAEDVFPDPIKHLTAHLAATRSHPAPYVDHLRQLHGDLLAASLLLRNNQRPMITLRADAPLSPPSDGGLLPHGESPDFWLASAGWNEAIERLVKTGALSPQDITAAKPVRALTALVAQNKLPPPRRILDLCAGLGTKSIQLARAFPTAQITAADIDSHKLARLAARVKALGLTTVSALTLTGQTAEPLPTLPFDLILIDAPCSNTGVMSRRVQSRWRWPSLNHPALHALQSRLLQQARASLAPTGTLIYATCSIDPAENQQRVAALTETKTILAEESTLPTLGDTLPPHDGGYYAILRPETPN